MSIAEQTPRNTSAHSPEDGARELAAWLRREQVRRYTGRVAAAATTALACLIIVTAAAIAFDHARRAEPGVERIAASVLFYSAWCAAAAVLATAVVRRPSLAETARQVDDERKSNGELVAAAEFTDPRALASEHSSAQLREAFLNTTWREYRAFAQETDSLATQRRRAPIIGAAVMLLVAMLTIIADRERLIPTAAIRLANPWSSVSYARRVVLRYSSPTNTVVAGGRFAASVSAQRGELPPDLRVHYRQADGEWTESLVRDGDQAWAVRESVTAGFSYWIEGGDDQSLPWIDVRVVSPPHVTDVAFTIAPPQYADAPKTLGRGELTCLPGSEITVAGAANEALESARLIDAAGEEHILDVDGRKFGHLTSSANLIARSEGPLQIVLQAVGGGTSTTEVGRLTLLDDSAPKLVLYGPNDGATLAADEATEFRFRATDDWSGPLVTATLQYEGTGARSLKVQAPNAVPYDAQTTNDLTGWFIWPADEELNGVASAELTVTATDALGQATRVVRRYQRGAASDVDAELQVALQALERAVRRALERQEAALEGLTALESKLTEPQATEYGDALLAQAISGQASVAQAAGDAEALAEGVLSPPPGATYASAAEASARLTIDAATFVRDRAAPGVSRGIGELRAEWSVASVVPEAWRERVVAARDLEQISRDKLAAALASLATVFDAHEQTRSQGELIAEQRALLQDTARAAWRLFGKQLSDLTNAQRNTVSELAGRQAGVNARWSLGAAMRAGPDAASPHLAAAHDSLLDGRLSDAAQRQEQALIAMQNAEAGLSAAAVLSRTELLLLIPKLIEQQAAIRTDLLAAAPQPDGDEDPLWSGLLTRQMGFSTQLDSAAKGVGPMAIRLAVQIAAECSGDAARALRRRDQVAASGLQDQVVAVLLAIVEANAPSGGDESQNESAAEQDQNESDDRPAVPREEIVLALLLQRQIAAEFSEAVGDEDREALDRLASRQARLADLVEQLSSAAIETPKAPGPR